MSVNTSSFVKRPRPESLESSGSRVVVTTHSGQSQQEIVTSTSKALVGETPSGQKVSARPGSKKARLEGKSPGPSGSKGEIHRLLRRNPSPTPALQNEVSGAGASPNHDSIKRKSSIPKLSREPYRIFHEEGCGCTNKSCKTIPVGPFDFNIVQGGGGTSDSRFPCPVLTALVEAWDDEQGFFEPESPAIHPAAWRLIYQNEGSRIGLNGVVPSSRLRFFTIPKGKKHGLSTSNWTTDQLIALRAVIHADCIPDDALPAEDENAALIRARGFPKYDDIWDAICRDPSSWSDAEKSNSPALGRYYESLQRTHTNLRQGIKQRHKERHQLFALRESTEDLEATLAASSTHSLLIESIHSEPRTPWNSLKKGGRKIKDVFRHKRFPQTSKHSEKPKVAFEKQAHAFLEIVLEVANGLEEGDIDDHNKTRTTLLYVQDDHGTAKWRMGGSDWASVDDGGITWKDISNAEQWVDPLEIPIGAKRATAEKSRFEALPQVVGEMLANAIYNTTFFLDSRDKFNKATYPDRKVKDKLVYHIGVQRDSLYFTKILFPKQFLIRIRDQVVHLPCRDEDLLHVWQTKAFSLGKVEERKEAFQHALNLCSSRYNASDSAFVSDAESAQ